MQNLRKTLPNFTRKMRSKVHANLNLKSILLACSMVFLLVVILRVTTSSQSPTSESLQKQQKHKCDKIPPSLARAIIHYSTSKDVPQQTINEISVTAKILEKKSPCNFLVFGLGHDSLMWASLNHGGRTIFLEEDKAWIDIVRQKQPSLESHYVVYNTKVRQADELLESAEVKKCMKGKSTKCPLALKELPGIVHEIEWDLIMVDAPTGYFSDAPGRMGAIYTAGMMARERSAGETHVFVHDVDRNVEDRFSKAFLCEGYLTKQEGRLRHFTIPSHKTKAGMPFCP